jgi:DedD protein
VAPQFKNRLVGVIILVALVVIFLPAIIDGKKVTYQQEFESTPINPNLKQHTKSISINVPVANNDADNDSSSNGDAIEVAPIDDWQVEEVAPTVEVATNQSNEVAVMIEPEPLKIEKPVAVTKPVELAKKVEATKPAEVAKKAEAAKPAEVVKPKPAPVVTSAEPAWTIQLGAFQNKANIDSLLDKLKKAGYQAHSVPKTVVDGQLTRVFVGPDVSKSKLENMLPPLKELTNLNGKILAFNPIAP